ncbi:Box C/D snoRNA protein 1 [Portunus trituberculatus]|uniref:Box C/D snoRNA protein 1 n=1 Tax=Portunus trituberculatus TaxID=210409 RepID=A0A5B7I6K6_PORTR|nr:Box C/D snoRNA protein 1 [Portunus trituberculatus]
MASAAQPVEQKAVANKPRVCEECGEEAKYTCPGCGRRTCSLGCVREHKAASGCSGLRDRTKLVSKEDMNNLTLLSDYSLLPNTNKLGDLL